MIVQNIPNADELFKLMQKHKLFDFSYWYIKVDYNPKGIGGPIWLLATTVWFEVDTFFEKQRNVDGVDYAWRSDWHKQYTGTFQLDTNPFQNIKPEVYKVGDTVEVLEVARKIGNYEDWTKRKKDMIGNRFWIEEVYDDSSGVNYILSGQYFPSYAVRKVVDFAKLEPDLRHKSDVLTEMNDKKNLPKIEKSIYQKFYDLANEYLDYSEQLFGRQQTYVHVSGDDYYLDTPYNSNIAAIRFTSGGERYEVTFGDYFEEIEVNIDRREFSIKLSVENRLEAQYQKFSEILGKIKEYHSKEFEAEALRNKQELKEELLAQLSNLENQKPEVAGISSGVSKVRK